MGMFFNQLPPSSYPIPLHLSLHPKQKVAKNTSATEVLYGGAAGGGKSHLMRVAAIAWCHSTRWPDMNT